MHDTFLPLRYLPNAGRVRSHVADKITNGAQGHLIRNSDFEAALQFENNIDDINRIEAEFAAQVAADTQARRLNGFTLTDDAQHLLLNGRRDGGR